MPLRSSLAPERAPLWLRGDRRPFALVGEWLGLAAVLGSEPLRIATAGEDPFELLRVEDAEAEGGVVVGGGWVGWLGYGLGGRIERLAPMPPAPVPRKAFSLAYYDHVVVFDGERWWFEALWSEERDALLTERLALWTERLGSEPPTARKAEVGRFELFGSGGAGHCAAVAECLERIAAGEIYQANICTRLQARFDGDPLDLFVRALPSARPRFGALVEGAVSLSPERFLRRQSRQVWTEPIKGTRPRTDGEDARAVELAASSKDAAEHVMIVDLMRNDLGRVCRFGSITAEPARVEPHAGVWHLVSTVSGKLREDVLDDTLLRATFPPGSVTGAPKVQAMKVITELESTRRELYTGAIGIVSPVAGLELSVAIRTFELKDDQIWFGAGGGIVASSDPELELAEALAKAAGPIAAIGGTLSEPSRHRRSLPKRSSTPALRHRARPDPGLGVFETIRVEDGVPLDLDAHLERLAGSLRAQFDRRIPDDTEARARQTAAAVSSGRMRLLADTEGSIEIDVSQTLLPESTSVLLVPFVLPGGLGAHKWRDRRLLESLAAQHHGAVPLLIDADGSVLEAAHANVWILEGNTLITPPCDGRLLPGITRAALLAKDSSAGEEHFDLDRLQSADAIRLTSSLRGLHPAQLC